MAESPSNAPARPLVRCAAVVLLLTCATARPQTAGNRIGRHIDLDSPDTLIVRHTRDGGPGSLRDSIEEANRRPGRQTIVFDHENGPFAEPQTLELTAELPPLTGELTIDGRIDGVLWRATGVTVSGVGRRRVFEIAPGADVTLRAITVRAGAAPEGAGILNEGRLAVSGVTLLDNHASTDGGGILNRGHLVVVNSTFYANRAEGRGGGLASLEGGLAVTHATFADNASLEGGGLYAESPLLLRNSIVADSVEGSDCAARGPLDPASTHNLIETNDGCGGVLTTLDPGLGELNYFNGPTQTLPLESGSPAINLADNSASLDEHGEPMTWDQRGNGDPRYVAGYADLGAFEHQAFPVIVVDTWEDNGLRGCTRAGRADCPLRGAIELAAASRAEQRIVSFDPAVFDRPRMLSLASPLPIPDHEVVLDATGTAGLEIELAHSQQAAVVLPPGATLELRPDRSGRPDRP